MISISKIKKINLIKKKWILKGIRLNDIGSNPHSKGEFFSRFFSIFFEKNKFRQIINKGINNIKIKIIIKLIII